MIAARSSLGLCLLLRFERSPIIEEIFDLENRMDELPLVKGELIKVRLPADLIVEAFIRANKVRMNS